MVLNFSDFIFWLVEIPIAPCLSQFSRCPIMRRAKAYLASLHSP